jgi:hypothetical protein
MKTETNEIQPDKGPTLTESQIEHQIQMDEDEDSYWNDVMNALRANNS